MKKFAAIALALILAMSSMFATVAFADEGEETGKQLTFSGFVIPEDSNVVVDVENMLIYGLEPKLHKDNLSKYLEKGDVDEMVISDDYLGTGSTITLIKDKEQFVFTVVIFGDVTGDSVYDVLDAAQMSNVINGFVEVKEEYEKLAIDNNSDGEIDENDYAQQVNAIKKPDVINQKANGTAAEGEIEVDDQVFDGSEGAVVTIDDVSLTFNDGVIDSKHYKVVGDGSYQYKYDDVNDTYYGIVEVEGQGLFSGTVTIKFPVVSLLEKIVATVNGVIEDAKLTDVVKVEKVDKNINVVIDAGTVISGGFAADISALNGLLAKIDDFRAKNLKEVSLVVEDYALASNGAFNRSEIKALGFDLVSGIFTAIANAENNTIKSYKGTLDTNEVISEEFTVNFVMDGTGSEIKKVKDFAAKIANFVGFNVVDGNAVVDIKMPAAFSAKVINHVGKGDYATAVENFNNLSVGYIIGTYLMNIESSDISVGYAGAIDKIVDLVSEYGDVVNKGLDEIVSATITTNTKTIPLLSGNEFNIDKTNSNKFAALVSACGFLLSEDVLYTNAGDFYKDGIYSVVADVELDYKGIKEKVIVNFDLFGEANAPDVIEETATHFNGIIADLGLEEVASISYDKDNGKALATLNATSVINGGVGFKDEAVDGLYTDIKGYFDDNYGTSTIIVDGNEIVVNGSIKKTALKNFLFDMVRGFMGDLATMNADNIIRSCAVKVIEADGATHNFYIDFQITGDAEDIATIKSIADKAEEYVSLDTSNGKTELTITLPQNLKNKIVTHLSEGTGDAAVAEAKLNSKTVAELIGVYLANIDAADISKSFEEEIMLAVSMIARLDGIINKFVGKVSENSVAYDVNGNVYKLVSGEKFVVENNTIKDVVWGFGSLLNKEVLDASVGNFSNGDGSYSVECDVSLEIGGIRETVIVNVEIF